MPSRTVTKKRRCYPRGMPDLDPLLSLLLAHRYLPAAALLIGLIVRLLKSDTKIPLNVPPRWRPWLALGLGGLAGALDKVVAGSSWHDALVVGLGAPTLAILGHVLGIESLRGDVEVRIPGLMKSPGSSTSSRAGLNTLLLGILVPCIACSSLAPGIPVLSTVDAIGRGVAHVVGWCEERGVEPATVASAKQAVADRDYRLALDLISRAVTASRKAGDPIPEDVEVTLRLAEGALAAQAIQDGMRALSGAKDAGAP